MLSCHHLHGNVPGSVLPQAKDRMCGCTHRHVVELELNDAFPHRVDLQGGAVTNNRMHCTMLLHALRSTFFIRRSCFCSSCVTALSISFSQSSLALLVLSCPGLLSGIRHCIEHVKYHCARTFSYQMRLFTIPQKVSQPCGTKALRKFSC